MSSPANLHDPRRLLHQAHGRAPRQEEEGAPGNSKLPFALPAGRGLIPRQPVHRVLARGRWRERIGRPVRLRAQIPQPNEEAQQVLRLIGREGADAHAALDGAALP